MNTRADTPTPEDDVKQLRDALAALADDVPSICELTPSEVAAWFAKAAEALEAQAVRLEAAERRAAVLEIEAEGLRTWKADVIQAAEKAHGPHAIRFKFSLRKNCTATNTFPKWLDQRWVSFVYAEDDAHIGYIAKALEAIDTERAAIASEAKP